MTKSYEEINEKIRQGKAVVMTAEEVSRMAEEMSPKDILKKVDVVTTATFGAMCSSGAILNFGHATPGIRMEKILLNDVPASSGLAAVDTFIGATDINPEKPKYGGAHVIQELIDGKEVKLEAWGKGTDCYPRKHISTHISLDTINEAILCNPRNAYQNYNVAINTSDRPLYTYMGILLPQMRNASYSSAGELSPLINDPECRTIGLGTKIFLCGAQGYVTWNGTQFNTSKPLNEHDIPVGNARTLALTGEMRQMSSQYLRAAYFERYGVSIYIGVGVPIPMLDEDLAHRVSIQNKDIDTAIEDYGNGGELIGTTNYAALRSGEIEFRGKKIHTAPLSSLAKAREIADTLKAWIQNGDFQLTAPVRPMPTDTSMKQLKEEI